MASVALPSAQQAPALHSDPEASAEAAGLRYVTDAEPGIRREARGDAVRYVGPDGKAVRDKATLARIRALAVPPAWTEVWICPDPRGHIQATGRDAKGRKQYRYHARWRAVRDETKFNRMLDFGRALPLIRARVERDLRRQGLPREKVLAAVVRLLETTFIRVGNEEYARKNGSYGLTTMRDGHATFPSRARVRFRYKGKAGKRREVELSDRTLARIVRRCQALPGQELFQYEDEDGEPVPIGSQDVNEYLRDITGEDFTAKDFRTWAGTVLAALALEELDAFDTKAQAKRNVVRAIEQVAERLGNTPAICRRCYVHPAVLDAYLDGGFAERLRAEVQKVADDAWDDLSRDEAAVMVLLQRRLAEEARERDVEGRLRESLARAKPRSKGRRRG